MKFLVDETHNPRGRIFSNYSEFRQLLELHGHEIDIYDDFPIKHSSIREADVFILPCCDGSKLYGHEIKALLRYIEDGRGIFVISHAGGDGGLGTNMNSLTATHFDIEIQSDQVFDEVHCDQEMPSLIVLREFATHPVTQGLEEICFVAGCSLRSGKKAQPVVTSDTDADPENAPLIAIWDGGKSKKGRVAVSGSYRMFSDYGAGINKLENTQLALNICEWLAKGSELSSAVQPVTAPEVESTPTTAPEVELTPTTAPEVESTPTTAPEVASPITLSELKKQRSMEKIKPAPSVQDHEPETIVQTPDREVSGSIVIQLPVFEQILTEIKNLRLEYQKGQEELKGLLEFLIERLQR